MTMLLPTVHHKVVKTITIQADTGSLKNGNPLTNPKSLLNKNLKIKQTVETDKTFGKKNKALKNPSPHGFLFNKRARISGIKIKKGTVNTTNKTVCCKPS